MVLSTFTLTMNTVKLFLFCDIGVKNFCYLICDQQKKILDFETEVNFEKDTINSVIDYMEKICDAYPLRCVFIESQIFKNVKCLRIETVISTYLTLKNVSFKLVQSSRKYNLLGFASQNYRKRKKFVVEKGEEMLKTMQVSEQLKEKIDSLKKKDDFYDCVLMMCTEL